MSSMLFVVNPSSVLSDEDSVDFVLPGLNVEMQFSFQLVFCVLCSIYVTK